MMRGLSTPTSTLHADRPRSTAGVGVLAILLLGSGCTPSPPMTDEGPKTPKRVGLTHDDGSKPNVVPEIDVGVAADRDASKPLDPPDVVSIEFMKRVASKDWPLTRFFDEERGVLSVDYTAPKKKAGKTTLLCGEGLKAAIPSLDKGLSLFIEDVEFNTMECVPEEQRCFAHYQGEYATIYDFRFVQREGHGLALDAILLEEYGLLESYYEDSAAFFTRSSRTRGRCKKAP